MAEAISGQLQKIGVKASVVTHEWGGYVRSGRRALADVHVGWAATWDADGYYLAAPVRPALRTLEQPGLRPAHRDRPHHPRRAERRRIYSQASRLAHDEAPWLFLWNGMDIYGSARRFTDWEPTSDEATATVMLAPSRRSSRRGGRAMGTKGHAEIAGGRHRGARRRGRARAAGSVGARPRARGPHARVRSPPSSPGTT